MRKVLKVKSLENFSLDLEFDDGVSGIVDLAGMAGQGVLSLWNDPRAFERVRIGSSGELVWDDQIDLCPEALYLKITGKKSEELFPMLRHESSHA